MLGTPRIYNESSEDVFFLNACTRRFYSNLFRIKKLFCTAQGGSQELIILLAVAF